MESKMILIVTNADYLRISETLNTLSSIMFTHKRNDDISLEFVNIVSSESGSELTQTQTDPPHVLAEAIFKVVAAVSTYRESAYRLQKAASTTDMYVKIGFELGSALQVALRPTSMTEKELEARVVFVSSDPAAHSCAHAFVDENTTHVLSVISPSELLTQIKTGSHA